MGIISLVQHLDLIPCYVLYKPLCNQLHSFYILMFSTWSTWSPYQPKCSHSLLIDICVNDKKLADKLLQSPTKLVNPNLTPFPAMDQHGGVVPLFLPKKLVRINSNFQNPKICIANHHRNNLKPILHVHHQYHSRTPANLLT